MISEMKSRSPRVVGILKIPTRSASGWTIASQVMTAKAAASSTKKSAVGGVHAIHAMFSMADLLDPAEREASRDIVTDKPDDQSAGNDGQNTRRRKQTPVHSRRGDGAGHHRRNRLG